MAYATSKFDVGKENSTLHLPLITSYMKEQYEIICRVKKITTKRKHVHKYR